MEASTTTPKDKVMVPVIIALSIIVPIVVIVLMNLETRIDLLGLKIGTFPFFHAIINASTAVLLAMGYALIKKQNYIMHKRVMITAFGLSAVFLISYVISKISHDPVPYGGEGVLKYIYFFILISHIVLSGIIIPLVLFTMYRGLTGEYQKHKKIARWTFPIWMYVAITGVLVYLFMMPYY
jgi:putative membrane protein